MAYLRFTIDGAIKLPLPQVLQDNLPEIKAKIRILKGFCENINEGQPNEEDTTRFKYHICHHDDIPSSCEPEQDI